MKKIIFSLLVAIAFCFGGCDDTNENLVGSRGIPVIPVISDIDPAFYTSDLANSHVQFTVSLQDGDQVDAAEVQITYKGKTVVMQDISSFPATIDLQALDVLSKLGVSESEVQIDDVFLMHVVTTSGTVTSRSQAAIPIMVTCQFDPALTTGSYHVVSEDWQVEGDVTFAADPNDPYKILVSGLFEMEGGAANDNTLELNINPSSFQVEVVKSVLGPTSPWGAYHDYSYGPGGGLYKSCDGSFVMQFKITVAEGSFGTYNFLFTRN